MATPKRPGSRPDGAAGHLSKDEQAEACAIALDMLAARRYKSEISGVLRRKFNLSAQNAQRYISWARRRLCQIVSQSHKKQKIASYGLYLSVLRDLASSPREKVLAQQRIDQLLGLDAPIRMANFNLNASVEGKASTKAAALRAALLADPQMAEMLALMAERQGGLGDALPDGSLPENLPNREAKPNGDGQRNGQKDLFNDPPPPGDEMT
jgi:hypothetical protein